MLASSIPMFFYKIDKKTKDEMRAELARRRLATEQGGVALSDNAGALESAETVESVEQPEQEQAETPTDRQE